MAGADRPIIRRLVQGGGNTKSAGKRRKRIRNQLSPNAGWGLSGKRRKRMRNQLSPNAGCGLGRQKAQGSAKSEAKETHFRADAEFCGSDEEQPLREVVAYEHEVVAVWYRLDELVPGEDEVGEYEEYGAESEKAAALEHGCDHHETDEACVDAYTDVDDACRGSWSDPEECDSEEGKGAEYDHGEIALGLSCELAVRLNAAEVPACEVNYIKYMAEREEAHLPEEVAA